MESFNTETHCSYSKELESIFTSLTLLNFYPLVNIRPKAFDYRTSLVTSANNVGMESLQRCYQSPPSASVESVTRNYLK